MMQSIPIRRTETERPPEVDVVEMIWHCETKRLSAADRRAYEFLHEETQGGRQRVLTTTKAIGRNQGTSNDAGKDRLNNLQGVGLIDFLPAQKRGSYEVWLLEPFQALRALGVADPQLDLPFVKTSWEGPSESQAGRPGDAHSSQDGNHREDLGRRIGTAQADSAGEEPPPVEVEAEEPREVPPEDPRRNLPRRPSGPLENASAHTRPSTIRRPSEPSGKSIYPVALAAEELRRGSSGGSSAVEDLDALLARKREQLGIVPSGRQALDPLEVARVASVAAAMTRRLPSETEQARTREHWIHTIRIRVKDPALKDCVMVKVACAIARQELDPEVVVQILAALDSHRREGTLRAAAGKYFFFAARRAFEERGLTWQAYHKPKQAR